jgi:3-hydroxyacyl-[acyl-carrier-protein] dehydratase
LIIESIAQIGGLLLLLDVKDRDSKLLYMAGVDAARFRRPVIPGDQLRVEVNVLTFRGPFCKVAGFARVNGELAVEATVMCAMVDLNADGKPERSTNSVARAVVTKPNE